MDSAVLQQAWADHLGAFAWSQFGTLTNAWQVSRDRLAREFRRFTHRLERRQGGPVPFFRVIEGGPAILTHIHVLLYAPGLTTGEIAAHWRVGLTEIGRFEPGRLVGHYLTKAIFHLRPGIDEYVGIRESDVEEWNEVASYYSDKDIVVRRNRPPISWYRRLAAWERGVLGPK